MAIKRRPEDESQAPQPFIKRSTTTSTTRNETASPPSLQALSFSPRSSNASTRSTSTTALTVTNRDQRQRKYREELTKLNYQMYLFAKNALENVVSGDGFYTHISSHYIQQAAYLKQLYCKQYGDVAVFGSGEVQLGLGQSVNCDVRSPRIVAGLRGLQIGSVAAGGLHTLVLTDNNEVWSFGPPDEGALGGEEVDEGYLPCKVDAFVASAYGPNGDKSSRVQTFEERRQLVGEANIVQIVAGETTSFALSEEGDVFMWGSYLDTEGRKFRHLPPKDDDRALTGRKNMAALEDFETEEMFLPPRGSQDWPMHLCLEKKAKEIASGEGWAVVLLVDGTLVTFGIGTHGEMARPVPELNKKTPNEVVTKEFLTPKPPVWSGVPISRTVTAISCGAFHLLAATREVGGMSVYSSGMSNYGQLGLGDKETRYELTKIDYLEGRNIGKVEAGYHFSCFVSNTGKELYICGRGDYGQLGYSLEQPIDGAFETTPMRVPLVYTIDRSKVTDPKGNCIVESDIVEEDQPEIEQISCGTSHTLVLTKEGDVYSWGFGESGACGHGKSDADVLRPKMLVTKLENAQGAKYGVKFIAAGGQHSAVVVATGSKE